MTHLDDAIARIVARPRSWRLARDGADGDSSVARPAVDLVDDVQQGGWSLLLWIRLDRIDRRGGQAAETGGNLG